MRKQDYLLVFRGALQYEIKKYAMIKIKKEYGLLSSIELLNTESRLNELEIQINQAEMVGTTNYNRLIELAGLELTELKTDVLVGNKKEDRLNRLFEISDSINLDTIKKQYLILLGNQKSIILTV